jgi:hypothetical protein
MPEKEPQVTFIDRRKISSDGEIRPEAAAREKEQPAPAAGQTPPPPPPATGPQPVQSAEAPAAAPAEEMPAGPTQAETEQSHAAYRETTEQIDNMLREKSPDAARMGPVGFEHLLQSMYMTAMMALGAGTQPGEKPRIDLMGARQTIDLLAVLGDKTKGNLTADEQRLLESALFELRMTFLEITNAIARQAANPPQGKPEPKRS